MSGHSNWAGRTVWLDMETMKLARDRFWTGFKDSAQAGDAFNEGAEPNKRVWDIAWAASIAAYAYLMEGRLEPGR